MNHSAHQAYAIFCDGNSLERIDASPEDHIINLNLLLSAVVDLRVEKEDEIRSRCPHCKGTGSLNGRE